MDPVVFVIASGLKQEHARARILCQAVCKHATRRAGTHDDVVVAAFEQPVVRHVCLFRYR